MSTDAECLLQHVMIITTSQGISSTIPNTVVLVMGVKINFTMGPGLSLLLASWLSWQDLAKFLLHLGSHGSHGKILIKILLR